MKVEVEGSAIINAIVTSKRVNDVISKYFLLTSPAINLISASWDKTLAADGETVNFHVSISNYYREQYVSGTLKVVVVEYSGGWFNDKDVQSYSFSVSLDKGKSASYVGSFTVYRHLLGHGFYLKVYWQEKLIYEMTKTYPPMIQIQI